MEGVVFFGCIAAFTVSVLALCWLDGVRENRRAQERERSRETAEALRQAAREMRARRVEANTLADAIRSGRKQ